ncbi:alpha-ketoglutarate-dependent dioxygenase AlkB [Alteromonas aestuariivivens]|uniref:Alpha-ketoglutarate-dependent dioxygenase AlkB n=2 Tax=Alteromonas aestuariivivens TaxID=1938339 RepID=A0A3D8MCI6_9ALTE|nr:alpha-ketoglutarate-dependent dioxygenase AlkB [Alteromonas aestuariivivens]RDV28218.1 alpha-ketoglutarate-dependent dioxygenase AlkB [Alteromonas aestuariivivens]
MADASCHGQSAQPVRLPLSDGCVDYYPGWLSAVEATRVQQALQASLPWQQDTIKLFGKPLKIPRLQSWHGDPECVYAYSNLVMDPHPWTPQLSALRRRCEQLTGTRFNSVLANWYRDGQDSMGLHADDEPELGPKPVIASLTFGAARPFVFKHKRTGARYSLPLAHGSLLIMAGATQAHYLHGVAKTSRRVDARINLTFRWINPHLTSV